ncbi:MAG: DNA repair protein RecO [Rhodospirillaceae bacterium]|nr:DNA repair protein RecO [Rhodospirillaceae bacterium]MDD9917533.1 DNA repair protein RecO [Rhodospirillaceae bacterium]MDD9925083.1 DNA repair protein RecO [Rhodospirillaceae bacterium]
MEWTDHGIVLSARRHGESSVVLSVLTEAHGQHAGLVRGGQSRRRRGVMEPGNLVAVTWRARLEEHLGNYTVELETGYAARLLDYADRLAALTSLCATLDNCLAEREAHPQLFSDTLHLIHDLDKDAFASRYVLWEFGLLGELGFGLDLSSCAATGVVDDLIYVSPRSAQAVSRDAGAPYRDKLLKLPAFLKEEAEPGFGDILDGLRLTGYFLDRHVFQPQERRLPDARERFVSLLQRKAQKNLPDTRP